MATKATCTRNVLSFDYALKRLLRQKANFDILNGFLSELLGRSIMIEDIPEGESQKERPDLKQTRVDMLARDSNGELIIIEVQYQYEIDYLLRILFGVSRHLVDNIYQGSPYETIKKIYSISIIYFNELSKSNEYIYHGRNDFRGMHTGEVLQLSAKQQLLFGKIEAGDLYPEYYLLDVTKFNDVAVNTLDEWIYYLKNNEVKESFTAKGLDRVREVLAYDALSDAEKLSYRKALDIKLGWESAIKTSHGEGLDEGIAIGKAEGKAEGLAEGIAIGEEKGIAIGIAEGEKNKALVIAAGLLKEGLPLQKVAELTGLPPTELHKLQSKP